MDLDILLTILLCVVAAVFTLVSLFFFAKRKQKSYEEVKQDEMKADLALSKELSTTPRSKPAVRQYKPWTSRKKKSDEVSADSSAHVTSEAAHMTSEAAHVLLSEPIQVTDEITEQPVVKVTKKKRPQQSIAPSSSPSVAVSSAVAMETAVETTTAVTVETVQAEESKSSTNKQKKPNKSSVEQPAKHKHKKTGRKDGDTASFSSLSSLLESSPLGDDQIQELVDMLLTRKDDGWQSANKGDDSVTNWKKKFNEMKEQCEDVQKEKSSLTATVKRQREEITQHQAELRQHKASSQQKMQQLNKEITQLKTRLQSQEEDVSAARTTIKNNQQLQEEHNKLKLQLAAVVEKERQAKMELVTLQQSSTLKSNGEDHNVLSHVKELEETLVGERRRSSEESIRLKERINRLEVEKKQYEDNVQELKALDIHKEQQLQETIGRLQDAQQMLDTVKDSAANTEAQARSSNNELQERLEKLTADKETTLVHHQEEVKLLKDQLNEMTSLCDAEKQSCETAQQELQHCKDELQTVQEQLQVKDQDLTNLQQQLQHKEEGLNQKKDDQFAELQQQLQQKGEEVNGLKQQLEQKGEGLNELQLQLEQKNNENVELLKQFAVVQEQLTRIKEDNATQNGDSISLTTHNELLQKKEAELVEMREENKLLKEKNCELEKQIDTLEERIDELLDQTVKQKEENQQMKDEAERSLKEQLTTAERSSREQGSRQAISECKSFLLNLFPNVIVSDSQEFSDWKESFKAQVTNSIFSKLDELESVQAQLADKEAQEVNFTEERQKLMQTLEATKGMLEDLQEELETHDHDLQQKLHEAENKLEQEKVANRMLSQQLQSEQDKSNSVAKQLEDKQSIEKTLQEQLNRSHEDIKSLKQQIHEIRNQKEELTLECKKLHEQLAAAMPTATHHRPVNESSV